MKGLFYLKLLKNHKLSETNTYYLDSISLKYNSKEYKVALQSNMGLQQLKRNT